MNTITTVSKYGLLLGFIALLCTAISSAVFFLTKDKIDATVSAQQRHLLAQVIPSDYFDNDLLASCLETDNIQIPKIYTAKQNQQITAYAFETIAPDGYSGNIHLLVGLTPQGEILGVRTIIHKETPGLGDKIELRISNWILSFNQQRIDPDNLTDWAVKKDGGKFDQFTGATITPRAVVNQVKRSALMMLQQPPLAKQPCEIK